MFCCITTRGAARIVQVDMIIYHYYYSALLVININLKHILLLKV
jgi:hypothetical protein